MRKLKTTTCLLILIVMSFVSPVWADARDVMLVLDNSGSMRKNDPEFLARGAVGSFIEQLDEEARAGIIIFDHGVNLAVPLTAVNAESRASMSASLSDINYRGQLTDSPAAVERAIYELKTNGRADAAKFIVFITDGIVDTGNADADIEKTKWLREELAVDAADNDIKVYAIAFTENADFFLIQSLAKKTNGEYFRALNPSDLAGVFATVHEKLTAAPASKPATVTADSTPASTTAASGAVITPVPDDTVAAVPITDESDPAALLASLTEDERLALEDISAQTGVPVEQLALELVGPAPEGDTRAVEPGKAIITYPEDQISPEEERAGLMLLAAAAVILLLIVGVAVWLLMRKRKPAASASQPSASASPAAADIDEGAVPEAFINDTHGYTDDTSTRLGEKPLMVGRVAGTDTQHLDYLVINQGTVGRRHAIIKYKDFTFWIVDQGSVNGTFVNGERLSGERQLKHGDTIRFHKYDFQFSQPEMDDGAHTVFADPNMADATIVATAETMATAMMEATAAQEAPAEEAAPMETPAAEASAGDGDDLFDIGGDEASVVDESPAAAFADSDVFDITGETAMPDEEPEPESASEDEAESEATVFFDAPADGGDDADDNDDDFDEEATALFDSPVVEDDAPPADADDEDDDDDEDDAPVTGEYFNEEEDDEEDLGVEINLDAVGADDHPSLILNSVPNTSEPDFDAEASAFFEDITVGPTPDDEAGPAPDAGGDEIFDLTAGEESQSDLDAKLEKAAALMDDDSDASEAETVTLDPGESPGDPNDVTLEDFIETDSFDAPATIPPAMPKQDSGEEGDVTLEAFMDTAMFEGGKVELTNEDKTMLPDQVPDDPRKDANVGDTVILDKSALPEEKGDDDDDGDEVGSEDPTVMR